MTEKNPSDYIRKEVIDFNPYVPGEQPGLGDKVIKLNTNENPYPPSPKIHSAVNEIITSGVLRKYPNYHSSELQNAIAKKYNLDPNQILVTNGSDEALRLLFYALLAPGDTVVAPEPTYSFYPVLTEEVMLGAKYRMIPLLPDLHFDFEALSRQEGKLLCFAHPNAPTGILEDKSKLLELVKGFKGVVLSDEAYIDFTEPGMSLISEIANHPNLVVTRTFSKSYSLAGLRVGFIVGELKLIDLIRKLKDSYNVGILDQTIAVTAWEDEEYFGICRTKVLEERARLTKELTGLGFEIPPSATNFIFCKPKQGISPEGIYLKLKEKNILVRYFSKGIPKDYVRISIGTKEENDRLLSELSLILG
ncbi:histidinol-phosphate transaminase [Leptospira ilyithenensis]|uniref:Histidinol-phosphate aminotransferase n=1 Tax=Leptospira ilyithenensis TaxID=2484901 RepID=A0A4R9LLC1_9LEPT|nr:histidinol-phosphate transaminase [Leptospira ilyithenensis]TGN08426.1 histidinol-phosphate transaminase [Leptospira ilyithenensis]